MIGFGQAGAGTGLSANEVLIEDMGGEEKIVLVKLNGIILSEYSGGFFESATGIITPEYVRETLQTAANDPMVRGVVLQINSPGGSPVASDYIWETIQDFKQDTGIPVVALMGDMATSGGYYIASIADYIVANPATITGSIGVILESYNLEELYEKIGVNKVTIKQGEYKDILNDSRAMTEDELEILNALSEDTYEMFVQRVAAGRELPTETVLTYANGQIYSGTQAKDLNLVDSLGNYNEAVYQAKSLANLDRYMVVEYSSSTLFSQIFGEIKSALSPFSALAGGSTLIQQR